VQLMLAHLPRAPTR